MQEKVYVARHFLEFNVDFHAQKSRREKYFCGLKSFLVQQKWKIIKSFYAEKFKFNLFSFHGCLLYAICHFLGSKKLNSDLLNYDLMIEAYFSKTGNLVRQITRCKKICFQNVLQLGKSEVKILCFKMPSRGTKEAFERL